MSQPTAADLTHRKCKPCEGGVDPLSDSQVSGYLNGLPGWSRQGNAVARTFRFKDHHQVMAFVNAVAWISHAENHHPDMEVGYNTCTVRYTTHAIGGLSDNDFICAAKVQALLAE